MARKTKAELEAELKEMRAQLDRAEQKAERTLSNVRVQLSGRIPHTLREAFREVADELGLRPQEALEEAVRDWVEKKRP